MDEKEAEARPVMGTIFLVIYSILHILIILLFFACCVVIDYH